MNKNTRNVIIFSLIAIGGLILMGVLYYVFSHRTVTFDIIPDDTGKITIYNQNDQVAGTFEQDSTLRLQPGMYTYVASSDRYTTTGASFEVTEDTTVTVNPSYSDSYRREILESENPAIIDTITSTYPNTIRDFTIDTGTIYQQGDWYATTLVQNNLPGGQQGDVYRIVLHKVDGTWQIAAEPAIVLSAKEYPDVPYEILQDINAR